MKEIFNIYKDILFELGHDVDRSKTFLDLGCGKGDLLHELVEQGYQAMGTDLVSYGYQVREDVKDYFTPINENPYSFPYEDDCFDFILSNQVAEHVQNPEEFFFELRRILKPGGISINIFPSKYRFIEPHVKVPFAGMFQSMTYFKMWSYLGLRAKSQNRMSVDEVASFNYDLITYRTNYLSRSQLRKLLEPYFCQVLFVERYFIKHGTGKAARYLGKIIDNAPILASLYGVMHTNVLCLTK